MKKTMTKLLLVLLIGAMVIGCAACSKNDEKSRLEAENASLQAQLEDLNAQMESIETVSTEGLKDWHMSASVWEGASGATVSLSAVPSSYHEGQSAVFSVRLNNYEVASVTCEWNGTGYTAEADLESSNGYSYYLTLIAADGSKEQIALNTPENTVDDTLVNLQSSMAAYGNIIVDRWEGDKDTLTLNAGFIQVQLPRISANGGDVDLDKASLVFQLNGSEIQRRSLELPTGEGEGSYELAFENISFDMPEMESDYQLDLWLEISLTDGQVITSSAGSWYHSDDGLMMVVG